MPKQNNKEKQEPNFIVFLVEGESDIRALELPLSNLIYEKHPDYQVRFLLQERLVNQFGGEVEIPEPNDEDIEDDEEYIEEPTYEYGGDITTSNFVEPYNIESKITNRFIKPAIRKEGIYPKKIAKVIQIVDLDGAYIPNEHIIPYSDERQDIEDPYYDGETGLIEFGDVPAIIERNEHKRNNLEYLLNLPEQKIKIKTKKIPYEVYFFSSNLDHFINNDANLKGGKKNLADRFLQSYGFDTEKFADFFTKDESSVGYMGYEESWDYIKEHTNSVCRHTNIDCLIRKLMEDV